MRLALIALGAVMTLIVAQVAMFDPRALPSMILSAAVAVLVFAVQQTRVSEAKHEADSAHKRECHHGASTFQPYDGDESERGRS
jgi:hypothetical protein